ncbi:MAG TPA: hypothetical protein PKK20_12565, partial [Verrucomicrobiota bacterium]|nr:hypothetical protein [Verrucomicrobiota bacterium]
MAGKMANAIPQGNAAFESLDTRCRSGWGFRARMLQPRTNHILARAPGENRLQPRHLRVCAKITWKALTFNGLMRIEPMNRGT